MQKIEILSPDKVLLTIPDHDLELELKPFTANDLVYESRLPKKIGDRDRCLLMLERVLTKESKKKLKKIKVHGFFRWILRLFTLLDVLNAIIPLNAKAITQVADAIFRTQGTSLEEVTKIQGSGKKK